MGCEVVGAWSTSSGRKTKVLCDELQLAIYQTALRPTIASCDHARCFPEARGYRSCSSQARFTPHLGRTRRGGKLIAEAVVLIQASLDEMPASSLRGLRRGKLDLRAWRGLDRGVQGILLVDGSCSETCKRPSASVDGITKQHHRPGWTEKAGVACRVVDLCLRGTLVASDMLLHLHPRIARREFGAASRNLNERELVTTTGQVQVLGRSCRFEMPITAGLEHAQSMWQCAEALHAVHRANDSLPT